MIEQLFTISCSVFLLFNMLTSSKISTAEPMFEVCLLLEVILAVFLKISQKIACFNARLSGLVLCYGNIPCRPEMLNVVCTDCSSICSSHMCAKQQ